LLKLQVNLNHSASRPLYIFSRFFYWV